MPDDIKFTLLTKEEYLDKDSRNPFKHDYQLEAIKKYGKKIYNTTLVKLTEGDEGYSWTKTKGTGNKVGVIDFTGDYLELESNYFRAGIRPVLKLPGRVDKVFPGVKPYYDGQCEFVELGEYPQYISADMDFLLESSYKENKLRKTGRVFHINNQICEEYYGFNDKKYIRYKVDLRFYNSVYIHRRFEKENGEYAWLDVRPVRWLVDKTDTLISEYNLLSGVSFSMDGYDGNFENTEMYSFLNNVMFRDMFQDYLTKKEDEKDELKKEEVKKEPKDNILQMIRGLLDKTKEIKDENDKINIVNDLMSLARLYTDELIKIRNKEKSKYSSERSLISEGILPYYVYIEREIDREINVDNKENNGETKEIEDTINNLINKASLISDEVKKLEIFQEIEELRLSYLNSLDSKKTSYERIDFSKPLEKIKENSGEVRLTFIPPKPVLKRELVEKELEISRKINQELNNNRVRSELLSLEEQASDIVKR